MKSSKINRILSFIDKDQRRSGIFLILLMFIASIAELFGLGMVILMINSFLDVKNSLDFPLGNYLETNIKSINSPSPKPKINSVGTQDLIKGLII